MSVERHYSVGDRVFSVASGLQGVVVATSLDVHGQMLDVEIHYGRAGLSRSAHTTLSAPASHFMPYEDIPIGDPDALARWLDS